VVATRKHRALCGCVLGGVLVLAGCSSPQTTPLPAATQVTRAGNATPTLVILGPQPVATALPTPTSEPLSTPTTGAQGSGFAKPPKIGGEAADFTLLDLDGNEVTLSSLRGKVVLLNFFATWCPPCNAELPHLMALYEEYKEQGFEVLAVDQLEPGDTVRRFVAEYKIPFTVLLDSSALASRLYNVRSIPRSLFINADGVIEIDHLGYMSEEVLRGYIEQMLE
jgi:peroxiredoxin